jgi:hypothetical protein
MTAILKLKKHQSLGAFLFEIYLMLAICDLEFTGYRSL